MLTININSIKNDSELFVTDVSGQALNPQDEIIFKNNVHIHVRIYRTGEQVIIKGFAETEATLSCSRCLVDYRQPIKTDLLFVVQPGHSREKDAKEETTAEDDPGIIICNNEQLDLIPEISSVLLLALPMKPLCKESCLGLCSNCGVNLNVETCACGKQEPTTPFATLKAMIEKEKKE